MDFDFLVYFPDEEYLNFVRLNEMDVLVFVDAPGEPDAVLAAAFDAELAAVRIADLVPAGILVVV
ncbi:MAG TPA: hypothetical protein DCF44_12125 [Chitinophagaceae bacterium]|nr:hypothetical protein [Chitinophagaceae bacterium]